MEKKQSSIDWLYTELTEILCDIKVNPVKAIAIFDRLKQAKAMHQEEIKEAYDHHRCIGNFENGEQYYKETFGGKDNE